MKTEINEPPIISLIIGNYDGKKFLKDCLDSIFKEKNKPFEVILIDDGSTDGSAEYLEKNYSHISNFHLIKNKENLGTSRAYNAGVKTALGKYLFLLNNDTIIQPGWFDEVIKFFDKYKKAAVFQAKIYRMDTNRFDYAGDFMGPLGFLIERAREAEDKGQFDKIDKIFSVKGTAMIVRKNVWDELGGFDEDYKFSLEETDFTWRAWLAGYETLFCPYIQVWHFFGTKKKSMNYYIQAKIFYQGCRNTIATHIKNLGTKRLFTMLPLHIGCWFGLVILSLIRLDFYKASAFLRGIGWNIIFLPKTLKKRAHVQATRKISDDALFKIVGDKKNIGYYFGKAWAYVRNKPY